MSKTIAKGLRERKTLANTISINRTRSIDSAVMRPNDKPDFDTNDCRQQFSSRQHDLRILKTRIAQKTANYLVLIPDHIPVGECGTEVPLFQAILIRDDLKARKQFLAQLINIPLREHVGRNYFTEKSDEKEIIKERKFDAEKLIKELDDLQNDIDAIDALIQYVDNTVELD